jgi:hypothetical protein
LARHDRRIGDPLDGASREEVMKPLFAKLSCCAVLVLFATSAASAQSELPAHRWSRGTTLAGVGGVATASDGTGAALGGTIGWEMTRQVGIEGTGMWIDREPGASAFSASLNVRAALTKTKPMAPFVEGGFGMYLAMFDPKQVTNVPAFYADRMTGVGTNTFTDAAFFASAGVELFRTLHFTLRPAVGAVIVVDGSRSYTMTTFTVQASYHFDTHPLAPQ